jgi:hypothetical protein
MEFQGRYLLAAPRDRVWAALNDAAVLQAVIPGCQRIEWVNESALVLEIAVNLGLFKPVFSGDLELYDVVPAERYTLRGRGRGGLLGLAHGEARIVLADHADGTHLAFDAEGGASEALMKLGQPFLGARAQGVIDRFFERFGRAMGARVTPLPLDPADG